MEAAWAKAPIKQWGSGSGREMTSDPRAGGGGDGGGCGQHNKADACRPSQAHFNGTLLGLFAAACDDGTIDCCVV